MISVKQLVRNIIPGRMWELLKHVQHKGLTFTSASPLASSLYYSFISKAFRREHQAVLSGRMHYEDSLANAESSIFLLRRNVHRIEKGLIMRPRRKVFATSYIMETVHSFQKQMTATKSHAQEKSDELQWAEDVLDVYFEVTGSQPHIDMARVLFRETVGSFCHELSRAPYKRDLQVPPSVHFDALYALSRRRRSVRWFEQRPVPRDLVDKALRIAVQAPSACNRQPYVFHFFDEPEQVKHIASIPMGTVGYSDNIPALAVVVGDQSAYFSERDRHVIYIDASLAAMSFLFALESLGLSSCCINWPDKEPQESQMKAKLGLNSYERVVILIAFGFPDTEGNVPYSQKKNLETVRTFN